MDRNRFESEVRVMQEPMRRFLRNLCRGDAQLADDIAQEAFIKAYLHLSDFNGKSAFSTWVFRIAYRCFYDDLRVKARFVGTDTEGLVIEEPGRSDDAFAHQELYMALERLNLKERTTLLLFYMEDKNLKEISDITRMPLNTVKSHLSRGKLHLNEHLNALGYEKGR